MQTAALSTFAHRPSLHVCHFCDISGIYIFTSQLGRRIDGGEFPEGRSINGDSNFINLKSTMLLTSLLQRKKLRPSGFLFISSVAFFNDSRRSDQHAKSSRN
jgi:hypothetical protein